MSKWDAEDGESLAELLQLAGDQMPLWILEREREREREEREKVAKNSAFNLFEVAKNFGFKFILQSKPKLFHISSIFSFSVFYFELIFS